MTRSTTQPKPHNLIHLHRDRGYRFQDRDPDMEELCNLIDKSGLSIGDIIDKVLDASDNHISISCATIANWLNGKTRRPSNHCLSWVGRALGYQRR